MIPSPVVYQALHEAATSEGVDFWLLAALTYLESTWDYLALGDKSADGVPHSFGLGQLNDKGYGAGYPVSILLDPYQNAKLSARALRWCLNLYPNDVKTGIACYNMGPEGVKKGWEATRKGYVESIYNNWQKWSRALPFIH